jgi:uncharacterized protein YutD
MEIVINEIKYKVVKNYREGFDEEEVKTRMTDYFEGYDFVFGDWAYGKLRLKGFYNKDNKKVNKINNIEDLDKYIKENCAYDCKYFLLEKEK